LNEGSVKTPLFLQGDKMARFFKKANGVVFQATANHDIKSLEDRFVECDKDGKEIVIEKPKKKKAKVKDVK
tara:strand:+ start:2347 stop:2559 length:213 start_codon:yes stop_codon:yes gene_type:complete